MSPQSIPKRVLVVDDDPMSRELLGILLEGEGYTVESAESGETALALLDRSKSPFDLVLADVQLPGISGAQLARKLRRATRPATVLLAMSGSQPPALAISLFDGFLLKPFKMEQVEAALHARVLPLADPPSKRKKSVAHSSPARTRQPKPNQLSTSASAHETASKNNNMNTQTQERNAHSVETADAGPVLNETIYRQLARSMPTKQLKEMYAMCVNDARRRIAGMRTLAADYDAARFVREAHAIKGGCGMLGATELHRMAAQLEANGPDGSAADGAPGVNSLDELSAACDRLERMLGSRV